MNKFYFTGFLGTATEQLLSDIKDMNNVIIFRQITKEFPNTVMWNIHNWWYTKLMPRKEISCGNIWNKYYPIYNEDYSKGDNHYIVFCNSGLVKAYNRSFFLSLKKKNPNIKLILYIVDPMNGFGCRRIKYIESVFDLVISHVEEDCEVYHYEHFPLLYSRISQDDDINEKSDIYFCGGNGVGYTVKNGVKEYARGGRVRTLHKIYNQCITNQVQSNFYMNGVNELDMQDADIHYNKPIEHTQNIANVKNTNCILEIMHDGFNAITTRYLEAICYNKKLLTNNKNVKNMKYYNEDYIKIFDSIEHIDYNWIKDKVNVDYDYKNDYSPIRFLDYIVAKLNNKL